MTDPAPALKPAIFELNAYNPAEIEETIEKVGITKAKLPFLPCFILAVVAGGDAGLRGAVLYQPSAFVAVFGLR